MDNMRREQPGEYGTFPIPFPARWDGSLTANATNTLNCGAPYRLCSLNQVSVSARTVPADADGTFLVTIKKRDASAAANVTLSAGTFNLESLTAGAASLIPLTATLTAAELTFEEGDTLYIEIVNNSAAIDTQPADLVFVPEFFALQ